MATWRTSGNWYPNGLENAIFKWDTYVPLVTKGLKHCAANRKRRLSALPNVSPYIYDVKISGFTRSSIYIYDISRLGVNNIFLSD
jgi:hypothetical protein